MRTIYVDDEYRCHVANSGELIAIETDLFDGKCNGFIEGYRYIPYNEIWIRYDGEVFHGEMVAPFKPYAELEQIQRRYEESTN